MTSTQHRAPVDPEGPSESGARSGARWARAEASRFERLSKPPRAGAAAEPPDHDVASARYGIVGRVFARRAAAVKGSTDLWWTVAVVLVVSSTLPAFAIALSGSFDVWGAFLVAPVMLFGVLPLASWIARTEGRPELKRFVMAAAFVKIVGGSIARYLMVAVVYEEVGDSERYFAAGGELVPNIRAGDFSDLGELTGTRLVEILSGIVQAFTGPTKLGGFMVFSAMAFVGTVCFYRAFRIAYPAGDETRFRWLIFLFPSMLFWTSSIGKDAFMVLCLGVATLGLAKVVRSQFSGFALLAPGLTGMTMVRAHVTLILLAGAAVALPVAIVGAGRKGASRPAATGVAGLLALVIVAVAAGIAIGATEDKFGLEQLDGDSTQSVFDEVNRRTGQGGSAFETPSLTSLEGVPVAIVTVLARPFPWEAGSAQQIATAFEGILLLALIAFSLPRLARLPKMVLSQPMIAFAAVYAAAFITAFINIENFGILARQRVQLLPFLFVLLAMGTRTVSAREPA